MKEPYWIDLRIALALHAEVIQEHGGSEGIRSGGHELLESALARPRQRLAYEAESDLADLAASYLVGLGKNHCFVDGNKRIAFAAAATFLRMNGLRLRAEQADAYSVVLAVVENRMTESDLSVWLRRNEEKASTL